MNFSLLQLIIPPEATPLRYLSSTYISCDVQAHSFSQHIVNTWNELPTELVTTPTLSVFKRQFDSFHNNIFYNI